MTRAGREPSEDIARRIVAAVQGAGLVVAEKIARLTLERDGRFTIVTASCPDWPRRGQMLEVDAFLDLARNVLETRVHCTAADEEPLHAIWTIPAVRDTTVQIDELPNLVRILIREREAVIGMIAAGQRPPFPGLHWTWEVPPFSFRPTSGGYFTVPTDDLCRTIRVRSDRARADS